MGTDAEPATDPPAPRRRPFSGAKGGFIWPLCGLIALLVFNYFTSPSFFSLEIRDGHLYGSLVDIFNRGSIGIVLAVGMTLVIATGGVDLSVGSVMAISGAIAALMLGDVGAGPVVAGFCGIVAATFAGLVNGFLVAVVRVQPIVATLVLMVSGRGIARFITGERVIALRDDADATAFEAIGTGHVFGLPVPALLAVGLFLATLVIVRRTVLGVFVTAVGANERASRAAGLQGRNVKLAAYAFCGFCAGLAGLIDVANIRAADTINSGVFTELDAIFAVVVGGTVLTGGRFTLLGSFVGALLLQTLLTTMYSYGVAADTAPIYKSLVILMVCLLQSREFRDAFRWGRSP
ncbi:MAG: ABC transporter permease [Planctomycetota bacterium]